MSLEFIKPRLATAVDKPPPRAGWLHEVKHDGYRTLLIIERHKASAFTRNGFDWTDRYPNITKAADLASTDGKELSDFSESIT
jgi:bifunctional non-homologous end joining protein LigD